MKYLLYGLLSLAVPAAACGAETADAAANSGVTAEQAPALKPNVITWSTASEYGSFGYDVYRGLSENGPFTVINAEIIPGAGTTDLTSHYEYVDDDIEPDTTYWYYIESVSLTGERKRITPIHPSRPKLAVSAAD